MNKLRKTIDIDSDLASNIQKMADNKSWSFSYMCYVLLQQAVKEKNRKKKVAKDNNTEHNPADTLQGDTRR